MTDKANDVYSNPEIVNDMIERYTSCEDTDEAREAVVTQLAEELGKSKASIIGKLVREKVYIAKSRTPKISPKNKAELVDDLINALGVEFTESEATSMEKMTKLALSKMVKRVTELKNLVEEFNS